VAATENELTYSAARRCCPLELELATVRNSKFPAFLPVIGGLLFYLTLLF